MLICTPRTCILVCLGLTLYDPENHNCDDKNKPTPHDNLDTGEMEKSTTLFLL